MHIAWVLYSSQVGVNYGAVILVLYIPLLDTLSFHIPLLPYHGSRRIILLWSVTVRHVVHWNSVIEGGNGVRKLPVHYFHNWRCKLVKNIQLEWEYKISWSAKYPGTPGLGIHDVCSDWHDFTWLYLIRLV